MDDLKERARQHIREYGYKGFADHTVMPALMAEFAKLYHDSEVKKLNIPAVTQQSEPFINSDFAKYLAANYPTLLFDVTTAIESYTELINGG